MFVLCYKGLSFLSLLSILPFASSLYFGFILLTFRRHLLNIIFSWQTWNEKIRKIHEIYNIYSYLSV